MNPRNSRTGKFLTLTYGSPSDKNTGVISPKQGGQDCSQVCLPAKTGGELVFFLLRGEKQPLEIRFCLRERTVCDF